MQEYACRQHSLFGMSASWEVASTTQISRSGAAETGTVATQVADHIGGIACGLAHGTLVTERGAQGSAGAGTARPGGTSGRWPVSGNITRPLAGGDGYVFAAAAVNRPRLPGCYRAAGTGAPTWRRRGWSEGRV